ncbi:hypothetical protein [Pseudomonas baetica]|uniref:hypothetical protein n=1 Tax=Pseudomonas baetica TaxID=674054 RepID=UPI0024072903|nr:hypothetical protein [Pseudomonas baetica]MDF9778880.1 hypothetical protein [Pseudomonas baetica]
MSAVLGALLGLGIGYLWLASKQLPEHLRDPEAVTTALREQHDAAQARDNAEMQGSCSAESVKALPSGMIATCSETHTWQLPSLAASQ